MNIHLKNAISHFYPTPCYEQVYFEAVANAFDAGASDISIEIKIKSFEEAESLSLTISDNGIGFIDRNFEKFKNLLEKDNIGHKGLGRLVYLTYFSEVKIISRYDVNKTRHFVFDPFFDGKCNVIEGNAEPSGSELIFHKFSGDRIKTYDYLKPETIKQELLKHFFPTLFKKKTDGKEFKIKIDLQTEASNAEHDFYADTQYLTPKDVPSLKKVSFSNKELDYFQDFDVYYNIQRNNSEPKSIVTAICIDDRTIMYDLLPKESVPNGYQMYFLFDSGFFEGKVDDSRQNLKLPDKVSERTLKRILRNEVAQLLEANIPQLKETNRNIKSDLEAKYPHLSGYFPQDIAGLILKDEVLEEAQKKFFQEQKNILECEELGEAEYEKALEMSSRVLLEYILYRARIIKKLKAMDFSSNEPEIHNLIVPRYKTIRETEFSDDIFNNNIWMLDDKFMSYTTILSDKSMSSIIKEIALDDESDDSRPDITLVFSSNPETSKAVDLVVIELKKHGVDLAEKEEVVSQLRQRARKLLKYYPEKLDRIWFYGITDIDAQFRISLKEDGYKQLFSHGDMFYKSQPILVEEEQPPFPVDIFVMTYESFIEDAESRNSTFIRLLKESIRKSIAVGDTDGLH